MIRARIGEIELSDLLRALEANRANAVVTVRCEDVVGRVHLRDGQLLYASTDPGPHLGEYLMRLEYLTLEQTQELVLRQERENPGTPLGQLALRMGLLEPGDLREALNAQVTEALATLLAQRTGDILAEAISEKASQVVLPEMLDTSAVLFEAARRLDEWRRGKVRPEAVLRVVSDPTRHALSAEAWSVLELVDGLKRARSIALESDLPEAQVYHLLYELQSRGLLGEAEIRPTDPLILVVAESPLLRRLLLVTLERSRYRVVMPHDPDSARRMLEHHKPQAVILQVRELAERVRQLRASPDGRFVPIWAVSEEAPRGLWVRSARVGHIPQPFSEKDLLDALSGIKRKV